MPIELEKNYDASKVEDKIYKLWEESGYFNPDGLPSIALAKEGKIPEPKPFSIILPPPNVTGSLHVGHAVMLAIEDAMIRFRRMRGQKTLWLPGTDHAAIATQSKVESIIYKKEKKTRHDLGREEFLKRVRDYAATSHDTIIGQIKKMGASLDWSREAYTLDDQRGLAVRTAFKKMHEQTLIYRGARMVNWDPKLQTTVSDDEIEWQEEKTNFYYLKYGPFTIATARPETKFGDKYVIMHPDDERYKNYADGQKIDLEWINGPIKATIIKDFAIDMAFGTGVMTITPAHDDTDFDIAERYNLEKPQIIDEHGKLLPIAGEFAGMHIAKARPLIIEKLRAKGLVEKIDENYIHRIATNSRGGGVIEPQIKEQWFVDVNRTFTLQNSRIPGLKSGDSINLKNLMRHVVENKIIKIVPEYFEKTYFHWIDNLRDWCISRQLWFGHRIPVWYCGQRNLKRMGYSSKGIAPVINGERKTYRVEDYGLSIGDRVILEDSGTGKVFGYAFIKGVELTRLNKINLHDSSHARTYKNHEELIAELNSYRPPLKVDENSFVWIYTFDFDPIIPKENCGTMIVSINEPHTCPTCGSGNIEQDPDTLDTWFSSGLWTFSTLGWPASATPFVKTSRAKKATAGKPSDLELYHPTSVLETGYDILFFWVARMILMTGFLLEDVPFKMVYLHGLVRDEKSRKMSKSLENIIDPSEVILKYGADALRMAMVVGISPGSDSKLSDDKIKAYKHFANKLWNIARFVLMSMPEEFATRSDLVEDDQKLMGELEELTKDITKDMEQYRFYLAAEKIYHYVWHTFADKIIEESKAKLASEDPVVKLSAQRMLVEILTICLKLLHPFMPFITEEIYSKLPLADKKLLMVENWPN